MNLDPIACASKAASTSLFCGDDDPGLAVKAIRTAMASRGDGGLIVKVQAFSTMHVDAACALAAAVLTERGRGPLAAVIEGDAWVSPVAYLVAAATGHVVLGEPWMRLTALSLDAASLQRYAAQLRAVRPGACAALDTWARGHINAKQALACGLIDSVSKHGDLGGAFGPLVAGGAPPLPSGMPLTPALPAAHAAGITRPPFNAPLSSPTTPIQSPQALAQARATAVLARAREQGVIRR
jgi:hypothetical protein